MSKTEINPNQLAMELGEILQTFNHSVDTAVDEISMEVGMAGAKQLRSANNGGRWKEYPKWWGVTKQKNKVVYIHNKRKYRLTHLLEKGHRTNYKSGVYGDKTMTGAYPHIAPVEQEVAKMFEDKIVKKITIQN